MKIALLSAAFFLLPVAAHASEHKVPVEGSSFRVPEPWVERSEIADKAKDATLSAGGVDAFAAAWASPDKVPLMLAIHVRTHDTITKTMDEEFDDFHTGMKTTMEQGGAKFTRFDRSKEQSFSVSRFDAAQESVKITGVAYAGVEADGHLDGWTAECLYTEDADASICADIVRTYTISRAPSYFRPLGGEKAAPAATPKPKRKGR